MTNDVSHIFGLYEQHGSEDYIGEPVSQLDHMLQAGELAKDAGFAEEVVLAAFFHDIGHLLSFEGVVDSMQGYGVASHEKLGADLLRKAGFSETIATLVESHVQAKRYLTYRDHGYYSRLSEASRHTLELQGGRMSEEEAIAFEADPLFHMKVQLRHWDDEAKKTELTSLTLPYFRELAERHLEIQSIKSTQ